MSGEGGRRDAPIQPIPTPGSASNWAIPPQRPPSGSAYESVDAGEGDDQGVVRPGGTDDGRGDERVAGAGTAKHRQATMVPEGTVAALSRKFSAACPPPPGMGPPAVRESLTRTTPRDRGHRELEDQAEGSTRGPGGPDVWRAECEGFRRQNVELTAAMNALQQTVGELSSTVAELTDRLQALEVEWALWSSWEGQGEAQDEEVGETVPGPTDGAERYQISGGPIATPREPGREGYLGSQWTGGGEEE